MKCLTCCVIGRSFTVSARRSLSTHQCYNRPELAGEYATPRISELNSHPSRHDRIALREMSCSGVNGRVNLLVSSMVRSFTHQSVSGSVDPHFSMLTRSLPIWKLRQMRSLSSTWTWRIGIHSWYARTPASFLSVKHAPEGEKEHPAAVSLLSVVPAFQALSATS